MKIIYIRPRSVPSTEGMNGAGLLKDRQYIRARHIARADPGRYQLEFWRPYLHASEEYSWRDEVGVLHRIFPSNRYVGLEVSWPLVRALRREQRQQSVAVEIHDIYEHFLSYLLPLILRVPVIGQSYGTGPALVAQGRKARLLGLRLLMYWVLKRKLSRRHLRAFVERRVLPRYEFVFAANSDEALAFTALYPGKPVSVQADGTDFDAFRPIDKKLARLRCGLSSDENVILFVGRLAKEKGVEYLIDALPLVAVAHPSCRLLVIGEGTLLPELRQRARDQGEENRVSFLGSVPRHELVDWYSAADVFVLPSFSEGCSRVCREALACGTPIVATDVGGTREIIREFECGIAVPVRDSQAIAKAVTMFLNGQGEFLPNRERGRAAFGWDTVTEERLRLYAELSARQPDCSG
jgi:glycosyltransferase involved in cell wall biosynthesis